MFLQEHNKDSYPILCQELSKTFNTLDPSYDNLIQLVNHPYSVPLSVIHYVTTSIVLEDVEDVTVNQSNIWVIDFFKLYKDTLARNLKIDPFLILQTGF